MQAESKITTKRVWSIAYPIILGSVVQNIIGVTDTAFLGRVGEVELGAAAIGGVFYLTLIMLGLGFSIGSQIIVARRFGEKRQNEIGSIIEHSFYFLILLSITLVLLIKIFMPEIFNSLIKSGGVKESTQRYFNYRILGLFFAFINFSFRAFYIGIARTKVITLTTIIMALVNVFLDYALIFGNFGFKKYGIEGAAMASVVAEVIASIFFILYTLKFVDNKYFGLFKFIKPDFSLFKTILKISMPMMLQNFVSFTGWFFFFLFVEKMGEHSLAISNVIRSIYVIMLIPIWGFTSATNTLVSFLIGKGKTNQVFPLIVKILKLTLIGVLFIVIINILIPEKILSIYTNNKNIITDALPALYVVSISSIFISVGFILFSGVSGTGMTKVSFLIETIVIILYVLITYLLVNLRNSKIEIVWTVEIFYGIIIALLSYLYLRFGKWANKKI